MQTALVMQVYQALLSYYRDQHWLPAKLVFKVMLSDILTQNDTKHHVEKVLP